jgi:outer membrane protein
MRVRLIVGWLVILTMVAAIGYAQAPPAQPAPPAAQLPPARQLSLADALRIARENNPAYLTTISNRNPAAAQSLYATTSLFTPTFSVFGGSQWTQAGVYNLQGLQFNTPRTTSLAWNLSFDYSLSGTSIANRGYAAAQLKAADQDIAGQRTVLETAVKQEYINLLEARAQADLAQHVVAKDQELLNLAQAQYSVGQKTIIDVKQAQVVKGNADVALLQAQQNVQVEVLKLFNLMGIPAPEPPDVVPTDTFAVVQPTYDQDSLVQQALQENPVLLSYRAREGAAEWNVRGAYSQYLPTLQFSAGYGRFTQDTFDSAGVASKTTGISPWNLRLGLSLPIFDAFSRHASVSQARASQRDLEYSIRQQELAVRANVSGAYLALMTAYRTIGVQASNRAAADDALSLAEEQYRVGSGSIIQLNDAEVASEQAGVAYVNAVYDYHKAVAALEQAVGRPLR